MADLANKIEESVEENEIDLPDSDEILDDLDDFFKQQRDSES